MSHSCANATPDLAQERIVHDLLAVLPDFERIPPFSTLWEAALRMMPGDNTVCIRNDLQQHETIIMESSILGSATN
eukprot:2893223-Pleurochrysis_carterae.AAC.2